MANALNRNTLEYRTSVDPTELPGSPDDWLLDPQLPACEPRWWVAEAAGTVREMTDAEKLPGYRADKLTELDRWWAAVQDQPVTVGGLTLAGSIEDQNRFTSLASAEQLAVAVGAKTTASESGLADAAGTWHTLTVAEVFGVLLQYAAACQARSVQRAQHLAAINAAASKAELDAISLEVV